MPTKRDIEREIAQLRKPGGIDKHDLPPESIAHVLSGCESTPLPGVDGVVLINGEPHRAARDWMQERADLEERIDVLSGDIHTVGSEPTLTDEQTRVIRKCDLGGDLSDEEKQTLEEITA